MVAWSTVATLVAGSTDMAPQVQEEVDRINELLPPHLKLGMNATDVELWAAIFSLNGSFIEGPTPHRTWRDAAISEKVRRIAAEEPYDEPKPKAKVGRYPHGRKASKGL